MKNALSLATFTAAVLCFATFLIVVKPEAPMVVQSANTDHCKTRGCDLNLLTAMSQAASQPR